MVKTYLIASGIVDILWPVLFGILPFFGDDAFTTVINTYQKWKKEPGGTWQKDGIEHEKSRGIGTLTFYAACILLLGSFALWCCGNAWVLANYKHVQYHDPTNLNYCYPSLFKGAFASAIIADIWCGFLNLLLLQSSCYFYPCGENCSVFDKLQQSQP
ncbi:unnamed protein product [Rotaria socialis]|uniref:Uncharacterized protein n=1 Tax=Rotaria socialis TaxID=392032 RepID=A0A820NZU1_9BILA|nr:unnamed protein product [Rotaria socialis]CAF4400399.1 unnamed protein product [Rotaria socialis]CAF4519157.1 unnamed protein product [Rotaria socialis]CAF4630957.1 unnamed protein product [Rotaria socialis]CAF4821557.1 unnamed protein product [Rotaria socialis]